MKIVKSKKKRIQNKQIPKGMYCYNCKGVCPYYNYRKANDKDLIKIYEKEIKEFGDFYGHNFTLEEAMEYMKTCKDKEFFLDVHECKLIKYTEYCQESLLWDQCKECGRNEGSFL